MQDYPNLFVIGCAILIVLIIWALARNKPKPSIEVLDGPEEEDEEQKPIWVRPNRSGDLTEGQVRFMQHYKECCYCHSDLFAGPRGGLSQNFFCGNPDCDSRFNFVPLPPDHPQSVPWGEFTGTCPPDFIAERRIKLLKPKVEKFLRDTDYLDGHPSLGDQPGHGDLTMGDLDGHRRDKGDGGP